MSLSSRNERNAARTAAASGAKAIDSHAFRFRFGASAVVGRRLGSSSVRAPRLDHGTVIAALWLHRPTPLSLSYWQGAGFVNDERCGPLDQV